MSHEKLNTADTVPVQTGKNQYVLSTNGIVAEWDESVGSGKVVRATSPTLSTPIVDRITMNLAPAVSTDGANKDYVDSFFPVDEANLSFTNVTTANVTTAQHGLCPKLSANAAQFFNGAGNWVTPTASSTNDYLSQNFTSQTTVNVTHNFNVYPAVQVIVSGVVTAPTSITHNTVNDFTVIFGSPTSGTIIATVGSPQPQSVKSITNDYTALTTDRILMITASSKTVTLYAVSGNTGKELVIDNQSTGNITVDGDASETIESELTQTIPPDSAIRIYCTGTTWRIY